MDLQFYVFITTVMLTFEYGNGLEGLQKPFNGLQQTNNNKYLLLVVMNADERNKPISRTNYDKKTQKAEIQQKLAVKAHNLRMKEIIDFMQTHTYSTVYLLKEVQRIKRDHQIKDELRSMVTYLERPDKYNEKEEVLSFYNQIKNKYMYKKIFGVFDQKPNNAVINVVKDPFNDGVII